MDTYTFPIFCDIDENVMYGFSNFLAMIPDDAKVVIEITSHGGFVFYGNAIYQKIVEAQKAGVRFTAKVYGVAASSAADIVLVCDRIEMAKTAAIMIHSAWKEGAKDEGIDVANAAQLAAIHKRLPEYTENDLKKDRWFSADEALSIGLIDAIFDSDNDSEQARLCAKYLANCPHLASLSNGVIPMENEKKEEMKDAEKEASKAEDEQMKDDSPSLNEVVEKVIERLEDIDSRLKALESARAECGDNRDNRESARMKSLLDRVAAISKPCVSNDSVLKQEVSDPKADLEKYKSKYPGIDRLIDKD